ncbi:hypothetical protein GCM10010310_60390 [Streptomyces violaceolatus]|uniref:Uncharacterized protein n=1 Tax=Streptomyces violaceolatus TaxID=67378 RepID=A0ABN3TB96_9ACTN
MTRQPLRADTPRHAPFSPYAALPAHAPRPAHRRTRLSPPTLRVPLLAVRGSPAVAAGSRHAAAAAGSRAAGAARVGAAAPRYAGARDPTRAHPGAGKAPVH